MLIDVVMPQLGESVVEGVVVKWLVEVGELIAKDQPLLEISTDKVDAEIPSPSAGRVTQILVKQGETVPIQAVLAKIETDTAVSASAPAPEAAPKWDEETEGFPGHMARTSEPPIPAPPRVEPSTPAPPPPPATGRIRITPVVARMAAEHGLDLSKIPGTGIDGRVTRRDVEGHLASIAKAPEVKAGAAKAPEAKAVAAEAPPAKPAPPPAPAAKAAEPKAAPAPKAEAKPGEDQVVPWTPIRKKIAEHMVRSKQTSPHVHIFAEVDMHRVAGVRSKAKQEGVSLTYLPFVIHAAAKALRETPIMNATVSGESTVLKKDIHIAVAVDTEKGLLVPVLRHADRMSLKEISAAVDDFGARAKSGKITPDELSGGTFSITNPGIKGNLFGTPIINQPQVGILRLGQIVKRPVVHEVDGEDVIVIRPMMYLCCAYDHRVIDGVAGNGFLYRVREILEAGDFS
ncbi:dihydrolipoamide acetyltransferase family protein [Candidatus Deferrimicrobium sp.]|uniref:dihydrolipoamide acetyltransferase family protein n=1 Tax=Candidatus Deferrimicrobium sp. TaxID=3060586 RepID=UPI002ED58FA4